MKPGKIITDENGNINEFSFFIEQKDLRYKVTLPSEFEGMECHFKPSNNDALYEVEPVSFSWDGKDITKLIIQLIAFCPELRSRLYRYAYDYLDVQLEFFQEK